MKFLVLLPLLFTGVRSNLLYGRCSSQSCDNGASCIQFSPTRFYCQCIDSTHYGLRCELKKCQNGNSEVPCEVSEKCDGPNCRSSSDICERDQPCLNNGICTNTASGFTCDCPSGFDGPLCQIQIPCAARPLSPSEACRNNGYCSPEGDCICATGWSGARCEVDENECERNPCENFGTCINRKGSFMCACLDGFEGTRCERNKDDCRNHLCSPESTCIDGVDSYSCKCPEGRGGVFCNETLACRPDTCVNGYCLESNLESKCICDSGWKGDHCNEDIDECSLSACAEGSTCLNRNGSFECVCPQGRKGLRCESGSCSSDRECLNGGRCESSECACKKGFDGPNCEREYRDPCEGQTCAENKVCTINTGEIFGFSCECPKGFGGRLCTFPTNCSSADKTDFEQCAVSGCSALSGNGVCNQECNHFACGYDGGDCSAGVVPFSRCANPSFCARHFKDGKCDRACNNEGCLFDGFDCSGPEPAVRKNGSLTDIELIILVRPVAFLRRVDDFLASLSQRLRTTVSIKKTRGEMDVFQWDSRLEKGERVSFGSRSDARVEYFPRAKRSVEDDVIISGVLVIIQVDLAECTSECFSDAQAVAHFIGATEAKEPLSKTMPIHSALIVKNNEETAEGGKRDVVLYIICAVGLVIAIAAVIIASKRRLVIEAPIWTPPSKEAARETASNYYSSGILGMNGYQGFQAFGEPSSKMPAPVFKSRPPPIALPASSPLELAAHGDNRITPEMSRYASEIGRYQRTALHWLALNTKKSSSDVESDFNLLVSFGIDVNAQDEDGNTALHYACENARLTLVRKLLEAGADPSVDNELDMTPLHVAAKHFDDLSMELLIAHKSYKDPVKFDVIDLEDRTPLMHYAANSCHSIRGAQLLLKAGADVNFSGDKKRSHRYRGKTALHFAAQFNKENREMFKLLVKENANKDAQDVEEATPLWHAVNACNFVGVDELLIAGASLDFADQKERTPEALAFERGYAKISERLHNARLGCPIIGLSSYNFHPRSTPIQPPRIIKKPPMKKIKHSPSPLEDTTLSPPGLKASTSSGPSCLDSPHSDQGRLSTGASSANSSCEIGSPTYTPAYSQQPLQSVATMRPSPPYDTHDPNGFFPSLVLPPLSLGQSAPFSQYPQFSGYNPPACAYQNPQ